MAITGPIPLPGAPGESFFQGAVNTQNILSKILEGRQNSQKIAQQALANKQLNDYRMKELAQTALANEQLNKYRMGQLAISRQVEQRQQTLMPYLIEQYKDAHNGKISQNAIDAMKAGIARHEYDQIMGATGGGEEAGNIEAVRPSGSGAAPAESNLFASAPIQIAASARSSQAPGFTPIGEETPQQKMSLMQPSLKDIMQPLMTPNYQAPQINAPMAPQANAPEQLAQQAQPVTKPGATPNVAEAQQEITLRPATKGLEFQDKLAGTSFGKPLKTQYGKNGWVYTEYPSGKITAVKNPMAEKMGEEESPDVKRQKDLEAKIKLAEERGKISEKAIAFKSGEKIEEGMDSLAKMAQLGNEAKEIFRRNEGKNLTGIQNYFGQKAKLLKNHDLNRLNFIFGKIQAEIAKYAASRGGIQAIRWAGTVKPDILNNDEANNAMLDEMLDNSKFEFEREGDRYKTKLGKEAPIKYPKSKSIVKVKTPGGGLIELPEEGAKRLIADHPDHKIVG